LPGQKEKVEEKELELHGLQWENYIIFYGELPEKQTLLIIQ
jgi:hypothetical protein